MISRRWQLWKVMWCLKIFTWKFFKGSFMAQLSRRCDRLRNQLLIPVLESSSESNLKSAEMNGAQKAGQDVTRDQISPPLSTFIPRLHPWNLHSGFPHFYTLPEESPFNSEHSQWGLFNSSHHSPPRPSTSHLRKHTVWTRELAQGSGS